MHRPVVARTLQNVVQQVQVEDAVEIQRVEKAQPKLPSALGRSASGTGIVGEGRLLERRLQHLGVQPLAQSTGQGGVGRLRGRVGIVVDEVVGLDLTLAATRSRRRDGPAGTPGAPPEW